MKNAHTIILSPIITEKSTFSSENNNAYTFKVASTANKIDIGKAVEEIFDVKVLTVNTSWQRGRYKRVGRNTGMTKKYKKAVVKLALGHKIDLV